MEKWYKNALMINRDSDWSLRHALNGDTKEEMEQSLHQYFKMFAGHKVTDVQFCIFEQSAFLPNSHMTFMGDKYPRGDELKDDVCYPAIKRLWYCCREYGLDPAAIFIEEMNLAGIHPWLALRMNDAHKIDGLKSDLYYEELEAGHMLGEEYGYYYNCFDFSYPKIRKAMLGFIEEILSRYDFFGLELDFMREIFCFQYKTNPDCHRIMTDFIRQVKALVQTAEARVGHPIRILIRTCRDPEDALDFGFDFKTYADEGLIDAVVPTPRWEVLDSDIPVQKWRDLIGDKLGLLPGIEILSLRLARSTPEQAKAYAAAWFAQGADGIYMNNQQDGSPEDLPFWNIRKEDCFDGTRRLVVTYQDIASGNRPAYRPLPLELPSTLLLHTGLIRPQDRISVTVDYEGSDAPILTIGSGASLVPQPCDPIIVPKLAYFGGEVNMTEHQPLSYTTAQIETENDLNLTFTGSGTIHYLELVIEP